MIFYNIEELKAFNSGTNFLNTISMSMNNDFSNWFNSKPFRSS